MDLVTISLCGLRQNNLSGPDLLVVSTSPRRRDG